MKNKKGFVVPLIITIVALLAIVGGVYIYKNKKVEAPVVVNSSLPVQSEQTSTTSINQNIPIINSFGSLNDHGDMSTVINGSNFSDYPFALVQLLSNGQIIDSFCVGVEDNGTKLSFNASSPETPGLYSNVNQLRVVNVDCINYKKADDISSLSSRIVNITLGQFNLINFSTSTIQKAINNLTLSEINNATYDISGIVVPSGTVVQFFNGSFQPEQNNALSSQGLNSVINSSAFGDINQDGQGDAVVVTESGYGPRDARTDALQIVLNVKGKPEAKNVNVPLHNGEIGAAGPTSPYIRVISIDNSGLITLKLGIVPKGLDDFNYTLVTRNYYYQNGSLVEKK